MLPIDLFSKVWERCEQISTIHSYISNVTTNALNTDELLRSEWVARVSSLDLFIHELVAQRMLAIFEGNITKKPPKYVSFKLTLETIERLVNPAPGTSRGGAFELEVRSQFSISTLQMPEAIADAVRCCSSVELWNEIALNLGASEANKVDEAKKLKRQLALIVDRRNKIAHEADLEPSFSRDANPITREQLKLVSEFIQTLVNSINICVSKHDFLE